MAVRRKPKLRVVGGEPRPPQHRALFGKWPSSSLIQFWTEQEFRDLADWERPDMGQVAWFPGHGYIAYLRPATEEEHAEIKEEYSNACDKAYGQRDLIEM